MPDRDRTLGAAARDRPGTPVEAPCRGVHRGRKKEPATAQGLGEPAGHPRRRFRWEGVSLRYLDIGGRWRDRERWAITREELAGGR